MENPSRDQWAVFSGVDFHDQGLSEEEEWMYRAPFQEDQITFLHSHFGPLNWPLSVGVTRVRPPESSSDVSQLNTKLSLMQQELSNCMELLRGLADSIDQLSETRITAINSIGHDTDFHILNRPLFITIEEDENEVVASAPEIQASGFGSTDSEAIDDLKIALGQLYLDLSETPDHQLGKLPLAWRRLLMEIVGTNATTNL